jgi:hypothetical protein
MKQGMRTKYISKRELMEMIQETYLRVVKNQLRESEDHKRKDIGPRKKRNVTRIKITWLADMGRSKELFMDTVLMLRHARNVGDEENVNNTVLAALKRHPSRIKFEIID